MLQSANRLLRKRPFPMSVLSVSQVQSRSNLQCQLQFLSSRHRHYRHHCCHSPTRRRRALSSPGFTSLDNINIIHPQTPFGSLGETINKASFTTSSNNNNGAPSTSTHAHDNDKGASSITAFTASSLNLDNMDRRTLYSLLKLSKFSNSEFDWRFDCIIQAQDRVNVSGKYTFQHEQSRQTYTDVQKQTQNMFDNSAPKIDFIKDGNSDGQDVQQREPMMSLHDLEAYLLERYQHFDDLNQQNTKNSIVQQQTDEDQDEAVSQQRMKRMQQCAKSDASTIFQLLVQNAPSPLPSSTTSIPSHETTSTSTTKNSSVNETLLTKHQFRESLIKLSTQIHYPTILPLATSMLLVGSSVGVISPIMPFVAEKLQLTSTHYGLVISSFAFSKMMGNVPSAILVERHGRKPYLVHSLWLVGLGAAGMGIADTWIQLGLCRMTVGMGVAALTTASTLTVADVSTPLSRASTFSPLMSAFAAGMALGPAIGGILHDAYGIRDTFFAVGLSYGVAAIWNHVSVDETKRTGEWWEKEVLPWHCSSSNQISAKEHKDDTTKMITAGDDTQLENNRLMATISHAIRDTTEQWKSLLADPKVRPVVIMNGYYMLALSGAQFTLLPLILTSGGVTATASSAGAAAGLALSASAVGQLYMFMSGVQVLGNPVAGRFADRAGKGSAIVVGGALTSFAMASVPMICAYGYATGDASLTSADVNWPLLAGSLGIWSLGGTLLATSHVAAISDAVGDSRRSQAIALLRTAGDVGYLCGAVSAGLMADLLGDEGFAMQGGSAILMGSTVWFGLKTLALNKLEKNDKK